jgi:hypothetical protein
MKRRRNSVTIGALVTILVVNILSFIYEYYYVGIQKKSSRNIAGDIDYQHRKSISLIFSECLNIIFYMALYHWNDVIRIMTESDFDFTFVVLLVHCVVFSLPADLLDLSIERAYGFSYESRIEYMKNVILREGIVFLISFFSNFIINIVLKIIGGIYERNDNTKVDGELESFEDQINVADQMPEIELEIKYQIDFKQTHAIMICSLIIFGIIAITVCCFKVYVFDTKNISGQTRKLINSLNFLNRTLRIDIVDSTKIRYTYKKIGHPRVEFGGILNKYLIISDNMLALLNNMQLSAIIAANYYRIESNEVGIIILLYLIEAAAFIILLVVSGSYNNEDVSRRFISGVVSKNVAVFYPIHRCFVLIRNFVHKCFILSADEQVVDKHLPIADALVRIYFINKDTVVHSHIYSSLYFAEPTLQDRLVNIAIANSKYAID